jgi:RimJ/RimL family protein N-acetyltransferase
VRVERVVILRTSRLAVTTWVPEDLDDLHRLHSDPGTMTFIGGRVETRDESAVRLTQYLTEQDTRGWTKWRVEAADGRMIGRGGFGVYTEDRELGYTIARPHCGRGHATELAAALVDWHRTHPASRRPGDGWRMELWAYADVDNVASVRVMGKAGLRFVETREHAGRPHAFFRLDASPPAD